MRLPRTASRDANFLTHLAQGVVNKAFVVLFKCISLFERDVPADDLYLIVDKRFTFLYNNNFTPPS